MAVNQPMRASDGDRDRVVAILREQTAQGRLTFEEFEERIDRAYTAKTWDELRALTEDLPVRVDFATGEQPRVRPADHDRPAERARRMVPARPQFLLPVLLAAIFAGVALTGAWEVLPFALIGVFWFAGGSCGKNRHAYRGPRPTRITPPRYR